MRETMTVLLHISAIGQTAFVILWATRPWYREWIGRALMVKSFSLMLFLDRALVLSYLEPRPSRAPLWTTILFGFVTLGIVTQLAALVYEMWRGRRPLPRE